MLCYKVWTRLADNEWGNELMDRKACEIAAVVPERPLLVSVQEHGGWALEYGFGIAGVPNGGVVNSANDRAVFPPAVNAFWRAMATSDFVTLWTCAACGRLAELHRLPRTDDDDGPRMVCERCDQVAVVEVLEEVAA